MKCMVKAHIEELERNGETYIGTVELWGMDAFKKYERIRKTFEKQHAADTLTVAWNAETGYAFVC